DKAARVSRLAMDISEYLDRIKLSPERDGAGLAVAYHSACSLQHGQKIGRVPKELLSKMGFVVKDVPEGHLCCGSAGIYNILQPELARRLRDRKVGNIEKLKPDVIAAGNIGCMTQIAAGTEIPVVHTVELIDWATGGPRPAALAGKGVSTAAEASAALAMDGSGHDSVDPYQELSRKDREPIMAKKAKSKTKKSKSKTKKGKRAKKAAPAKKKKVAAKKSAKKAKKRSAPRKAAAPKPAPAPAPAPAPSYTPPS